MKSRLQTTMVRFPQSNLEFYSIEMLPKMPLIGEPFHYPVSLTKADGTVITWDSENSARSVKADGTIYTWYSPPSMNYALKRDSNNELYQFHKDGSITAFYYSAAYYWSAETHDVEPEQGVLSFMSEEEQHLHVLREEHEAWAERDAEQAQLYLAQKEAEDQAEDEYYRNLREDFDKLNC